MPKQQKKTASKAAKKSPVKKPAAKKASAKASTVKNKPEAKPQAKPQQGNQQEAAMPQFEYAGFWVRLGAFFVDYLIVASIEIVLVEIMRFTGLVALFPQFSVLRGLYGWFFAGIVGVVYFTYMCGSHYQAGFGKRLFNLYIVDKNGNRLSYLHSFGRLVAYVVSAIPLNIGFFMIGFTSKKRGLHDLLASTYVVRGRPELRAVS